MNRKKHFRGSGEDQIRSDPIPLEESGHGVAITEKIKTLPSSQNLINALQPYPHSLNSKQPEKTKMFRQVVNSSFIIEDNHGDLLGPMYVKYKHCMSRDH